MQFQHEHLTDFQEIFMDTLFKFDDPVTIQQKLNSEQLNPIIRNWLTSLEPHMLEVASRMTQHWGKPGNILD